CDTSRRPSATSAPASASARAIARPSPRAAPVTRAIRPSRSNLASPICRRVYAGRRRVRPPAEAVGRRTRLDGDLVDLIFARARVRITAAHPKPDLHGSIAYRPCDSRNAVDQDNRRGAETVRRPDPESPTPAVREASRPRRVYDSAYRKGTAAYDQGRLWIENQPTDSRKGATIGWVRRYQAADGQLYAVLLTAYFFLTVVPLLLLEGSYVYNDPTALAHRVEHRLNLGPDTSSLVTNVLTGASGHKLAAALIAAIDLFFFRLGFGRVLQLVHARSWGIDLRKSVVVDQIRYFEVLGGMFLLTLVFVFQTKELQGDPSWIGWVLDIGWLVVLVGFFVWAPRLLLHNRVAARDILPGAVFTILGFAVMRLISVLLLKHWLEWYSKTYGAIGIVMAIFFWLIILSTIMV